VTVAELAFGVAKSGSVRNRSALQAFLVPLEVAPFDLAAALAHGDMRADLERRGQPIGPLDLQIAAHALSLNAILVTNNEREFRKVAGLTLDNWA
jgi:tRNA(fMet)-specific endonuclease VapC